MDSTGEKNKRIAKNTIFLYIRMGVVMLISLYTTRVVLNVLGVEDYGVYNVVCGFVSMFGILNTCFITSINRFYNCEIGRDSESGLTKVYNASLRIQFVVAVIVTALLEVIGIWYLQNKMVIPEGRLQVAFWIFQFAVFSLLVTIMQAPFSAAVMAHEKMDYFAIVSIVDALMKLGFVFVLTTIPFDKLLFYGILMCLVAVVNFAMYFVYCKCCFKTMRFEFRVDNGITKSMLSFSGWSMLDPLSYVTRDQGTNIVLNSFFGPIVNAAQGIAYQVATAVDSFTGSFSTSFTPQIIQSYSQGDHQRTKKLFCSMSKISFLLQACIALPVIFEINYLLNLWLGSDFPSYAPQFAVFVIIAKLINSLNTPISVVMTATGRIKVIKTASAVIICSIIPISIALFKQGFQPTALYCALLAITITNQIVCVFILSKTVDFMTFKEHVLKIAAPCILHASIIVSALLCVNRLMDSNMLRLVAACIVSLAVSVVFGYKVVLSVEERVMAMKLLNNLKRKFSRNW